MGQVRSHPAGGLSRGSEGESGGHLGEEERCQGTIREGQRQEVSQPQSSHDLGSVTGT